MQCCAMCIKLKKQFAAAFAVDSLFPFFLLTELFPLRGKVFFRP